MLDLCFASYSTIDSLAEKIPVEAIAGQSNDGEDKPHLPSL